MTTAPSDSEVATQHNPSVLADRLAHSYEQFWRTLSLLNESERERPCLTGGWSPKGLVAHVAFWDDFQTRRMQAALTCEWAESIPWAQENNDDRAQRDAQRSWTEVVVEADTNRQRMIDFTRSLSPEQIGAVYREGGKERAVLQILLTHMVKHVREHESEVMTYCGSLERWGRDGLRSFLVRQQRNFLDSIGGLSEATVTSVPICDDWTLRDVMAHVLGWEEYVVDVVRQWPHVDRSRLARWLVGDSIDAVNARLQAELAVLEMIPLLDGLATAHRRLLSRYDELSDDELRQEGDFGWGMRGALSSLLFRMAHHTAEHASDLWQARADGVLVPVER